MLETAVKGMLHGAYFKGKNLREKEIGKFKE